MEPMPVAATDPMPVVAGDAHRGHDPAYEVTPGRARRPVYERVERGELLRGALAAAGHPLVEPAEHGLEPILAVHEAALLEFLEGAWPAWRAAGGPELLIPDTFALPGLARPAAAPPAGGPRPAGGGCFFNAPPPGG